LDAWDTRSGFARQEHPRERPPPCAGSTWRGPARRLTVRTRARASNSEPAQQVTEVGRSRPYGPVGPSPQTSAAPAARIAVASIGRRDREATYPNQTRFFAPTMHRNGRARGQQRSAARLTPVSPTDVPVPARRPAARYSTPKVKARPRQSTSPGLATARHDDVVIRDDEINPRSSSPPANAAAEGARRRTICAPPIAVDRRAAIARPTLLERQEDPGRQDEYHTHSVVQSAP